MTNVKIIQNLLPEDDSRTQTPLPIFSGVTIHDTANPRPGAGAISHGEYLKSEHAKKKNVSWHFAVDDKIIVQSLPTSIRALHAGSKAGNDRTLAVEICVNSDSDILQATENAAELTAQLLTLGGLTTDNVYRHYDWSGKRCPAQLMSGNPYTWTTFKNRVNYYYKIWQSPKQDRPEPKPTNGAKIKQKIKGAINAIRNFRKK